MNFLVWTLCAFAIAIVGSEIALRGTKLQTGLVKVLAVHILVVTALILYLFVSGKGGWLAILIFWAGAFLTWFGVRSHMESSILLRMLFLLRRNSLSRSELIKHYESHYGKSQRLEELFRGRLLERTAAEIVVTPKGKFILRIVSILK